MNKNLTSRAHEQTTHQQQTLELSMALLERPSIIPNDDGCQDILSERLTQAGFDCEFMYYADRQAKGKHAEVKNLWARRGTSNPVICFADHTDEEGPSINGTVIETLEARQEKITYCLVG